MLFSNVGSTTVPPPSNCQSQNYKQQKKGYQILQSLKKLYEFNAPKSDLVLLYPFMSGQSGIQLLCMAFYFGKSTRGRFRKSPKIACKIILKDQYQSFENALTHLRLEKLSLRRRKLWKKFTHNPVCTGGGGGMCWLFVHIHYGHFKKKIRALYVTV